ncbi:response regulator transcription factor [Variovorax sp. J22P240]|uniref:response regulator n=1 Tax=unclassified Variovorax TaxID=663243 RepID=UPI0025791BC2|nr:MULTISPECIES: response regulator transcription factor [unclassified Variovorax]MDL9999385.1 response regulator transcription factor [Variovorax sp. J22P240]MDM0052498.1 response regulator transcription factor [Variovorax sp. J22R115]
MINVLIIDDHAMFRSGLRKVLQDAPDIERVEETGEWREGLAMLERRDTQVLLLDINLPDSSGLDVLDLVHKRFPTVHVIMLSMYAAPQYAMRALRNGAKGYVAKDMEASDLIAAIRNVNRGKKFIPPAVTEALLDSLHGLEPNPRPHEHLSTRESEIMRMIVAGEALTAIAERLLINVKTVSTYRRRILEKLGVGSNAQLVQYAVHNRLLD